MTYRIEIEKHAASQETGKIVQRLLANAGIGLAALCKTGTRGDKVESPTIFGFGLHL